MAKQGVAESNNSHSDWTFLGIKLCRGAAFRLTGAGRRLKMYRQAVGMGSTAPPVDLRTFSSSARQQPMAEDVSEYLEWMYWSVGETLPDALPDVEYESAG
eukprot:12173321-Alexandrium_andersonii.AAC.1